MVLQIDGECVVYGSVWNLTENGSYMASKRVCYSYDVNVVTTEEPFLVLYRTIFEKVLYRTTYNTFIIGLSFK